jgi:hypothetical protein
MKHYEAPRWGMKRLLRKHNKAFFEKFCQDAAPVKNLWDSFSSSRLLI